MPTIQQRLLIQRPVAEIFTAITAFDRIPEWIPSITRAYVTSSSPTGTGTTFVEEARLLGQSMRIVGTVTAYEPDHKLVYVYEDGPLPGAWQYTLTPEGAGTRLDFQLEIARQKGIFSARNPLVLALFRRMIAQNLNSFKTWVEKTAAEHQAVSATGGAQV